MIVPQSTPEKPLTAIDYCAALEQCATVAEVDSFRKQVPLKVLHDERFTRAVARRLAAIKDRKAA